MLLEPLNSALELDNFERAFGAPKHSEPYIYRPIAAPPAQVALGTSSTWVLVLVMVVSAACVFIDEPCPVCERKRRPASSSILAPQHVMLHF